MINFSSQGRIQRAGPCPPSLAECTEMHHLGIKIQTIFSGEGDPLPKPHPLAPRSPTLDPPSVVTEKVVKLPILPSNVREMR